MVGLVFYFLTEVTDCVLKYNETRNSLNDYLVMVISQPPGNNPSYYYRASTNTASIALNASRTALCSIHAIVSG